MRGQADAERGEAVAASGRLVDDAGPVQACSRTRRRSGRRCRACLREPPPLRTIMSLSFRSSVPAGLVRLARLSVFAPPVVSVTFTPGEIVSALRRCDGGEVDGGGGVNRQVRAAAAGKVRRAGQGVEDRACAVRLRAADRQRARAALGELPPEVLVNPPLSAREPAMLNAALSIIVTPAVMA